MREPAGSVVTGLGVVAPNGLGTKEFWEAALDARSGIGMMQRFDASCYPVRIAGEVLNFDPGEHVPKRLLPQTDRMTQYALAATEWALADAGIAPDEFDEYSMGVITTSAAGGFEFGQRELEKLWGIGPERVSAYQSFAWFYAVNTGQISIKHGIRGHSSVLVSEQAGGLDAAAHTGRLLEKGAIRIGVTGGLDAPLCPWGLVAQISHGLLSTVPDPRTAFLPFAREASGYVAGEGGAIMVLEHMEDVRARGAAKVYGTIASHASTFDPRPDAGRPSTLAKAIRGALRRARLAAEDINVVFADAIGVPDLDLAEAAALAEVFGPYSVPVTAPKTMTGRLYAGGSALDIACALLSIQDSVIPPTIGVRSLAPGVELDLVRAQPREAPICNALVLARGLGGFNSAMVVQRCRT